MPENTVYVGRGSPFGNPYVVRRNVHTPMAAVAKFREYLNGDPGPGGTSQDDPVGQEPGLLVPPGPALSCRRAAGGVK